MRGRPIGPLTEALRSIGVDLVHEIEEGRHPLTIRADGIKGGHITLDAGLSSQFLTALLLLGPLTAEGPSITVTALVSAPYVEITTAMMERFGVGVERDGDTYLVPPRSYTATDYLIEPDASTASYFLAAAALTGRSITIPGLGSHSLQGDLRFAGVLSRMGADVTIAPESVTVAGPALILLAVVVGCVGGIYGIGGGSILAPILIGTGPPPREVAPAGPSPRVSCPRLADRHRAGRRRTGGRIHRRPDPAKAP